MILKKLMSRKLWMAVAGVATGIAMALGANSTEIETVAGAAAVLVSAVTYMVVEGKVDAEGVKNTVLALQKAADTLQDGGDVHGAD